MVRLLLFTVIFVYTSNLCLFAQPVTIQPKSKANKYSQARSVFTRFKDLHFSNYADFDALKNMEINGDIFSGFSMSLGGPNYLFGFNYGTGILFDYYFKEGFALRTGLKVRGSNLFGTNSLSILDETGKVIGEGTREYQVNIGQAIIPINLLFTRYKRNTGLWIAFGLDFGLNFQGLYYVNNTANININDPTIYFPSEYGTKRFSDKDVNRKTYFNYFTLYGSFTVGYKVSRFVNLYGKIQASATQFKNAYPRSFTHHSVIFGMLLSLWQY